MNPQRRRLKLPLKTRVFLFFISLASDAFSRRRDGTVNRRLMSLMASHLGLKTGPRSKPDHHGVSASDVTVDPARNLWFRVYVPTTSIDSSEQKLPVVVFFHGGGFVYLSADMKVYDAVCRRFARKIPAVVVSVDYRLAPEHRYPAQYEDGFDVLKFLDENKGAVLPPCADLKRCFLAGDSAGGNIVHHVTVRLCKENDFSNLKVLGVLNIQPFFGGEERTKAELELADTDVLVSVERTDWMWRAFMSDVDRDHPAINVSGPRAEDISKLDNFPPVTVVIAGFDSLKDWQMRYYQWLKNSGKEVYLVEFPNAFHAFYVFPEVPESGQLMAEAKKFVETLCSKALVGN